MIYHSISNDEESLMKSVLDVYYTKHYRKIESERLWQQPILSSNGIWGCSLFACKDSGNESNNMPIWKAFNNASSNTSYYGGTPLPCSFWFFNDKPIKIKSITIHNRISGQYGGPYAITNGELYGSNDDTNYELIKAYTNDVISQNANWDIDLSDNESFYRYYRMDIKTAKGSNSSISADVNQAIIDRLDITAYEKYNIIDEDNDGDLVIYNYVKQLYCGKSLIHEMTNPISNIIDTISSSSGWSDVNNAFDNNESTYASCGTSTDYIDVSFIKPIVFQKLTVIGNYVSGAARIEGIRVWTIIDGEEIYLGSTDMLDSQKTTYTFEREFNNIVVDNLRFRLTEKNSNNNPPATNVKTRIRELKIN